MAQIYSPCSLWAQLALRAVSVVLALVSLGLLVYCNVNYAENIAGGYFFVSSCNLIQQDRHELTHRMKLSMCFYSSSVSRSLPGSTPP